VCDPRGAMKIAVLALQGAFREHIAMFRRCGCDAVEARLPGDLADIAGLVIPGGESTTIAKLIDRYSLAEPLLDLARGGVPIFGTCAGTILLSRNRNGCGEAFLELIDITVTRNAYGRQIDSHEADITLTFSPEVPYNALFIRAPVIDETGDGVVVLARHLDKPVFVRQRGILAATFHPELTDDDRVHRYFLEMIEGKNR